MRKDKIFAQEELIIYEIRKRHFMENKNDAPQKWKWTRITTRFTTPFS